MGAGEAMPWTSSSQTLVGTRLAGAVCLSPKFSVSTRALAGVSRDVTQVVGAPAEPVTALSPLPRVLGPFLRARRM